MTEFDPASDDEDDADGITMDHSIPYVLRVLYDRFWDDPDTIKPRSKNKFDGSRAAFLFWLVNGFDGMDRKQLCHEAEVEEHVCDQLADMLEHYTGHDVILTLWPVYTMATRDEPTKRVTALTVSIALCFDDDTVSVMQSQTLCQRTDPEDTTPLSDSSVMLAVNSTVDSMLTSMAKRGVDAVYKVNNISLASAYLAYTLFGKTAALFKNSMARNLSFLQQFIAGVFAPAANANSSFAAAADDADDDSDDILRLKEEIADAATDFDDEVKDFFDP